MAGKLLFSTIAFYRGVSSRRVSILAAIIHRRSSRRAMTKKKQRGIPLSLSKSRSYRVPFCEDKVRTRRGIRRTRLTFGEEIRKLFSFDRAKLTQRRES